MEIEFRVEGAVFHLDRQLRQCSDRINTASAQKDEPCAGSFTILQQIYRPEEIMFDNLAAVRFAVHSRKHARIGSGIDDPLNSGQRLKIACMADVAMI